MKRFFLTILAIASIIVFASSCNSDKFGTYEFFINSVVHVSNQDVATKINEAIASDSYFTKTSSYTANFSEAVEQATNDFVSHIDKLDVESIESKLENNDYVELSLWCKDPGNCWLTFYITQTGAVTQE